MTAQKLKSIVFDGTMALLLAGGSATLFLTSSSSGAPAPVVLTTFEPLAGEWEGTYETRRSNQPRAPRQFVTVSIHTSHQGRVCEIDLHVLDRAERTNASFHFSHALNASGDRIATTDDPTVGGVVLDGVVTEAVLVGPAEWRAGFRAVRPNGTDFTECHWARMGETLTIGRLDVTHPPEGPIHASFELTLRPRSNKPRTAYGALPHDTQTFDGVTFHIRKAVNLIGGRAASKNGSALARISDPTIRGRGRLIHVLHTGDHGASATGDFVWRLVLHYTDGESARFDFAYDIHLRNYWRRPDDGPPVPSDPNTSLAWIGSSLESDRTGAELVISRTTVENPRPDVDVIGAEFVSLLGPSSAYILAVTVSDHGPKPIHQEKRAAPDVPPLTFVFQTAAGQPQTNAVLKCEFDCGGYSVRLEQARPDVKGRVILDVPTRFVSSIQYQASSPTAKVEPGTIEISPTDKAWPPQIVRFPE